jgi:hypothetical protein
VIMSFWEAKVTIRDYVCSACWGPLDYIQHDKDNPKIATVTCMFCKDHTPGFVTKKYAERKAERNHQEFEEAKRALRAALPWMKIKLEATEKSILQKLGY